MVHSVESSQLDMMARASTPRAEGRADHPPLTSNREEAFDAIQL